MPWSAGDAKKHKKGLSAAQSRKWSKVANSVLADSGDEGKAIRIANSKTESMGEEALPVFDRIEQELSTGMKTPGMSIVIEVDGKKVGRYSTLGASADALIAHAGNVKIPDELQNGIEFTSGDGKLQRKIKIYYLGKKGEAPLSSEDLDDLHLLVSREIEDRRMSSVEGDEDTEVFEDPEKKVKDPGENINFISRYRTRHEDFGASQENEEEPGEEDRDQDAGGEDTTYASDGDGE